MAVRKGKKVRKKPLVEPTPKLGQPSDKEILSKTDPIRSVPLDYGAFLFVWDYVHRKNAMLERSPYFSEELRSVARRAAEAFSDASGIEPEVPRKSKKKRKRCPATNKRGKQCRRSAGHPPPHRIT